MAKVAGPDAAIESSRNESRPKIETDNVGLQVAEPGANYFADVFST